MACGREKMVDRFCKNNFSKSNPVYFCPTDRRYFIIDAKFYILVCIYYIETWLDAEYARQHIG